MINRNQKFVNLRTPIEEANIIRILVEMHTKYDFNKYRKDAVGYFKKVKLFTSIHTANKVSKNVAQVAKEMYKEKK